MNAKEQKDVFYQYCQWDVILQKMCIVPNISRLVFVENRFRGIPSSRALSPYHTARPNPKDFHSERVTELFIGSSYSNGAIVESFTF